MLPHHQDNKSAHWTQKLFGSTKETQIIRITFFLHGGGPYKGKYSHFIILFKAIASNTCICHFMNISSKFQWNISIADCSLLSRNMIYTC